MLSEEIESKETIENLNFMLDDIKKLNQVNNEIIDDFNNVASQFALEVPDGLLNEDNLTRKYDLFALIGLNCRFRKPIKELL